MDARTRWPRLTDLQLRHRGAFAYISAQPPQNDKVMPLCRLRYTGSASTWGFAIAPLRSFLFGDAAQSVDEGAH